MRQPLLDRLVQDTGLTPDALRITLAVAGRGAGWHRIKQSTLRLLLNGRGEKPIRTAIETAVECRWLAWHGRGGQAGGFYRFRLPEEPPDETERWLVDAGLLNDAPTGVIPHANDAPQGGIQGVNYSAGGGIHSESGKSSLGGGIRSGASSFPEVVVKKEDEEGGGEDGGAGVDAGAERLIQARAADLCDAADALRTYLRAAVPTRAHEGYTRGVLAVLDGKPGVQWCTLDGRPVVRADWPAWIATALTSLCTDEPTSRPRGSLHNFHTKLTILLKTDHDRYSDGGAGTNGRGGARGATAKASGPHLSGPSDLFYES